MSEKAELNYGEYCEMKRINFITFHPSYSYEEFVEGISVNLGDDNSENSGEITYSLKPGVFKQMCKRALGAALNMDIEENERKSWKEVYEYYCEHKPVNFSAAPKYVLIIDEINRGDIA